MRFVGLQTNEDGTFFPKEGDYVLCVVKDRLYAGHIREVGDEPHLLSSNFYVETSCGKKVYPYASDLISDNKLIPIRAKIVEIEK